MPVSLRQRVGEVKAKLDSLPDSDQPPPSMLHVLGRNQHERDWQRLLFHFLSPEERHGLGRDFLEFVLSALADRSDLAFGFSSLDVDDVLVQTEVETSNGGRVDAVMWVPETWFICWELKVYASETGEQTEAYVEAADFPTIGVDKRDDRLRAEYLYLAPNGASAPTADAFASVSWEWVAEKVQEFLGVSQGKYPARTTAQLADFVGTIQNELTMTEHEENEREKAELYLEYYDEVSALQRAFDRQWAEFTDTWGTRLAETLDHGVVVTIDDLREDYVVIEGEFRTGKREQWIFRQTHDDWAGITKYGWRRSKSDYSKVYQGEHDGDDIRLSLYHRLELNRERAIEEHTLQLQLWHGTSNPDQFMREFKDRLHTNIEDHHDQLPSSITTTGSKGKPLTATYDIPVEEYETFFEAYTAALATAFQDLVVENEHFVTAVDDAFEEALEVIDDTPN